MSQKKKTNVGNPHVTRVECQRIHEKVGLALWGFDGRGGMVKDISEIKSSLKGIEKWRNEKTKEEKAQERDYRGLLYSIVGGVIVAFLSWAMTAL